MDFNEFGINNISLTKFLEHLKQDPLIRSNRIFPSKEGGDRKNNNNQSIFDSSHVSTTGGNEEYDSFPVQYNSPINQKKGKTFSYRPTSKFWGQDNRFSSTTKDKPSDKLKTFSTQNKAYRSNGNRLRKETSENVDDKRSIVMGKWETHLQEMKDRLSLKEKSLQGQEKRLNVQTNQNESWEERLREKDKSVSSLRQTYLTMRQKLNLVEKKLSQRELRIIRDEKRLNMKIREVKQKVSQNNEFRNKLEKVEKELLAKESLMHERENNCKDKERSLKEQELYHEQIRSDLKRRDEEVEENEKKFAMYKSEMERILTEKENENARLRRKVEEDSVFVIEKKQEVEEKSANLKERELTLKEKESAFESMRQIKISSANQIEIELKNKRAVIQEEQRVLESRLKKLEHETALFSEQKKKWFDTRAVRTRRVEGQYSEVFGKLKAVQKELQLQEGAFLHNKEKMKKAEFRLLEIEKKLEVRERKIVKAEDELDGKIVKHNNLILQFGNKKSQLEGRDNELKDLGNALEIKRKEIQFREKNLSEMQREAEITKDKIMKLQDEVEERRKIVDQKERVIDATVIEMKKKNESVMENEKRIVEMKTVMQSKEAQLKSKVEEFNYFIQTKKRLFGEKEIELERMREEILNESTKLKKLEARVVEKSQLSYEKNEKFQKLMDVLESRRKKFEQNKRLALEKLEEQRKELTARISTFQNTVAAKQEELSHRKNDIELKEKNFLRIRNERIGEIENQRTSLDEDYKKREKSINESEVKLNNLKMELEVREREVGQSEEKYRKKFVMLENQYGKKLENLRERERRIEEMAKKRVREITQKIEDERENNRRKEESFREEKQKILDVLHSRESQLRAKQKELEIEKEAMRKQRKILMNNSNLRTNSYTGNGSFNHTRTRTRPGSSFYGEKEKLYEELFELDQTDEPQLSTGSNMDFGIDETSENKNDGEINENELVEEKFLLQRSGTDKKKSLVEEREKELDSLSQIVDSIKEDASAQLVPKEFYNNIKDVETGIMQMKLKKNQESFLDWNENLEKHIKKIGEIQDRFSNIETQEKLKNS